MEDNKEEIKGVEEKGKIEFNKKALIISIIVAALMVVCIVVIIILSSKVGASSSDCGDGKTCPLKLIDLLFWNRF